MNHPARPEPLTVLLLEDSTLIGARQTRMLRSIKELELLALARDPRAALLAAQILLPDVVILSLNRNEKSWLNVLQDLKRMRRHATVVVLSNCSVPPMRSAYLQAGASLFFDKTTEFDALRRALLRLAADKSAATGTVQEFTTA
ncbi:response regulator [Cupriavidus sp. D39]|uniref:response regulator n=1 Tax=Cupriavidus sp. D39 TaxID=2997877 RepID=UPI002271EFFD|nr:response regulator [Cupriavidus sp. D39]MCY0853584.1 response regulator [Cupriavidus sp. D39]